MCGRECPHGSSEASPCCTPSLLIWIFLQSVNVPLCIHFFPMWWERTGLLTWCLLLIGEKNWLCKSWWRNLAARLSGSWAGTSCSLWGCGGVRYTYIRARKKYIADIAARSVHDYEASVWCSALRYSVLDAYAFIKHQYPHRLQWLFYWYWYLFTLLLHAIYIFNVKS